MTALGLAELRKRAVPGRCLCCRRPVGPGRSVLCGRAECRLEYQRANSRDQYQRKLAPPAVKPPLNGYYDAREVPLLPPTGESYAAFCRRVEGCWAEASR